MSVYTWQGLHMLGFSNFPVTSNGIISHPSMFVHISTVILHLLLLPQWQVSSLKAYVFYGSRLNNNPHISALNISFGWYSFRSSGSILIFEVPASSSVYTFEFPAYGSLAMPCNAIQLSWTVFIIFCIIYYTCYSKRRVNLWNVMYNNKCASGNHVTWGRI
jgi:hypothetical protein